MSPATMPSLSRYALPRCATVLVTALLILLPAGLPLRPASAVTVTRAAAAAWTPKTPPLSTPWTSQVPVNNPLPEYP